MKNLKYYLFTMVAFLIFSCSDSTLIEERNEKMEVPGACESQEVSYELHIQPIISTCYNIGGCHYYGSENGNFNGYYSLKWYVDNGKIWQKLIVEQSMPPYGSTTPITQEERDLVACWIEAGALNN